MKFKQNDVEKLKSVALLFFLSLYCVFLIQVFSSNSESVAQEKSSTSFGGNMVGLEYSRLEGVVEKKDDTEEFEKVEEEVLGANICADLKGISAPQLFCSGSNIVARSEGTRIREGARVQLWVVTAPSALFTGAKAPFDNLSLVNNPAGALAFRNANEIVNPEWEYSIHQPPIDEAIVEGVDRRTGDSSSDKDDFGMHVAFGDLEGTVGRVNFEVDDDDKSLCPHVVNDGRFNVEKSNKMAEDLTNSMSPPNLMSLGDRENTEFCQRVTFNEVDIIKLSMEHSKTLCQPNLWHQLSASFRNAFGSLFRIITLSSGEEAEEIILQGVLIDAPFGSANACNEEDCAIRYLEAGRLLSSPPNESQELTPNYLSSEDKNNDYIVSDPKFLTTPCQVLIDGKRVDTDCYWDLSAWQHIFKIEENFTSPGYGTKYTEDEYWWLVEQELKGHNVLDVQGALQWRNDPNNPDSLSNLRSYYTRKQNNTPLELNYINVEMEDIDELIEKAREEDLFFDDRVEQIRSYVENNVAGNPFAEDPKLSEFVVAVAHRFKDIHNGKKIQLDYRLIYAIGHHESVLGTKGYVTGKGKHNAWGWGVHLGYAYNNWYEGIYAISKGLYNGYYITRDVSNGGSANDSELVRNIQYDYAPTRSNVPGAERDMNSSWISGVGKYLNNIGPKIGN